MNIASIKLNDIDAAARVDDLDAALLPLMDIAGIEDGGVAAECFSGFDWANADTAARVRQLHYWLRVEG